MLTTILTPNVVKTRYFARDADFQSAMEAVRGVWADTDRRGDFLWNCASLILRPDAIAGRQCSAVLPMLREQGFMPVVVRRLRATAEKAEALWKYQFNVATPERRELLKRVMTVGPAVYLLVLDQTVRESAPATVHLTYLKGTAVIARRKRGHLRTLAGPPVANIFSYVHVSDDPADMLREMIVLFGRDAAIHILAQASAAVDRTSEALALIRRLETAAPRDALLRPAPARAQDCVSLHEWLLHREWQEIVERGRACRSFTTGESYAGRDAIIPDDKEFSLPLDGHLIFPELGPRY